MNDIRENLEDYLRKPYSRILIPDEESGTYTGEILEFPGCIAQGDTAQEAYQRLEDAAIAWIEAALELGQEIPPPSLTHGYGGKVALRMPKSLHRQTAMAAERDGTSLNQFIVAAVSEKLGAHNLYEKLTKRMGQCFVQTAVNETIFTMNIYPIRERATTSMPPQLSIPNINLKEEVTDNAGNKKYNIYS